MKEERNKEEQINIIVPSYNIARLGFYSLFIAAMTIPFCERHKTG